MPGPRATSGDRRSGFTLLELLLAMAVAGVLAAALFGGMAVVFDARASAERQLDGQATLRIASGLLRDELSATMRPTGAGTLVEPFRGESGTTRDGRPSDQLTFVTTSLSVPTGVERGDVHEIEVALLAVDDQNADRGPYHLVQRVTDELNRDGSSVGQPVVQTLLRGVAGLSLRYHDGSDWVDSWDEAERNNELPRAVELTIELADADDPESTERREEYPRSTRQVIQLLTSRLEVAEF